MVVMLSSDLATSTMPNHLYLNGHTVPGDVNLAPNTHGPYTGTHWQAYMLLDGKYIFKCLGHIHNLDHVYLNGFTAVCRWSSAPSIT